MSCDCIFHTKSGKFDKGWDANLEDGKKKKKKEKKSRENLLFPVMHACILRRCPGSEISCLLILHILIREKRLGNKSEYLPPSRCDHVASAHPVFPSIVGSESPFRDLLKVMRWEGVSSTGRREQWRFFERRLSGEPSGTYKFIVDSLG